MNGKNCKNKLSCNRLLLLTVESVYKSYMEYTQLQNIIRIYVNVLCTKIYLILITFLIISAHILN